MNTNSLSIKSQSTIETCLSMCLIALLENIGVRVENDEEMNILIEGLKFTKFDYSTGHLVYICKKYNVYIEQYIDYPIFFQFLSKYKYPKNMQLIHYKINKKILQKLADKLPFIVYIDQFYLRRIHAPHFIILEKINDKVATILEPWDGKRKRISMKIFLRSIQSLRNNLKISPKIITVS